MAVQRSSMVRAAAFFKSALNLENAISMGLRSEASIRSEGMRTIGDFPNLTAAMQRRGWPEPRIAKVMGGNWLQLLKDVWRC
jgi:microsomal dipeptidase-like Zn-dependent dipeptidase